MAETNGSNGKAWYALYIKPKNEKKAALQLGELKIHYYLPTFPKIKQWSDRRKKVQEPVLRGYIFIFADERERMISLEQQAVVKCVFDNGRPAKIPEWQIENLKKMLSKEAEFFIKDGLIPGVKVKIKEGPFKGIIGVIQESDNGNNFAVSIELLRRSVIAHLPKDSMYDIVRDSDVNSN